MLIGKFHLREDGKTYLGDIIGGLALFQAVEIVPTEKKGQGPDYVIATPHGELGAAWKKTSKAGKAYLSVKLDSPFLPESVNCALVTQQDGTHALVWNRDRKADEEQPPRKSREGPAAPPARRGFTLNIAFLCH